MSLEPCAVCGRPGSVGNPELRMTLCWTCDIDFLVWWAVGNGRVAADWPALVGGAV